MRCPLAGNGHQLQRFAAIEGSGNSAAVRTDTFAFLEFEGWHTFAAPALCRIIQKQRAFGIANFGYCQNFSLVFTDPEAGDHFVSFTQLNSPYPTGNTAHRVHFALTEPDAHAFTGHQHDLFVTAAQRHCNDLITLSHLAGCNGS
ncbi:hypothetical protein D3C75_873570 [compost metagenome]